MSAVMRRGSGGLHFGPIVGANWRSRDCIAGKIDNLRVGNLSGCQGEWSIVDRNGIETRRYLKKSEVGVIRCTVEPRHYVEGVRKCAPLLGSDIASTGKQSPVTEWKAVPDIWKTCAEKFGDRVALQDPHRSPPSEVTYKELEQAILDFAEGLRVYGICPDQTVALIADNSSRWLIADQGIMAAGASNTVRGSRSSVDELIYIISHSDSVALVVDTAEVYSKLAPRISTCSRLKCVVVLWSGEHNSKVVLNETAKDDLGRQLPVYGYDELMASGRTSRQALAAANNSATHVQYEVIRPDDLATIVYTSGTSGTPKGVMLTHANLLHQIKELWCVVQPVAGDRFLSILPPWHMYERSSEYFAFSHGVIQTYSSVKTLKDDLFKYQPEMFVAVPLVFEILYNGVQKKLEAGSAARRFLVAVLISISLHHKNFERIYQGRDISKAKKSQNALVATAQFAGSFVLAICLLPVHVLAEHLVYKKIREVINVKTSAISGGGSLSPHLDKFFEAAGIVLVNGYGLTETSPVVACRRTPKNILGTVGPAIPRARVKVVDAETGRTVPPGTKGVVKVAGPGVMKGYYKDPASTRKALDEDGWLDTGDVGWLAPDNIFGGGYACGGSLVLEGRVKDTIVLASGENVDPTQVEQVALQCKLVQQIVVIGQDKRRVGALIVVNKDELGVDGDKHTKQELSSAIRLELNKFAREMTFPIGPFLLLDEPFTVDNGLLTPTLKVKRDAVVQQYKLEIEALYRKEKESFI